MALQSPFFNKREPDTYAQRQGHFSPEQERALEELRKRAADLLAGQ